MTEKQHKDYWTGFLTSTTLFPVAHQDLNLNPSVINYPL